jgi:nucleoside-diphosphate kinase
MYNNTKMKDNVTLCVLKPDAYERKIVDNIINDIQKEGFETTNFVEKRLTVDDVCVLYYESKEQPYFLDLLSYMTSGVSVIFLVKASNAVNRLNDFVGATNPSCSVEGTLRRKYGLSILKNTIHSANANRLYFEIKQLYNVESAEDLINFPYYFRLKDGTICHTVSEHCYESGKVIGIPKYFRVDTTERDSRVINGYYYGRNNSIEESILYSKLFTNTQVKKVNRFGEDLCLFDVSEIERIYNPFEKTKELYQYDGNEKILNDTKLIISIMINELGIALDDIGIEGSILIEGYQENSDIDIVVKGIESVKKLQENFGLLKGNRFIKLYDKTDLSLIFSRRKKYASFDTLDEMLEQECCRTVGLINGRRFWMQPILGNNYLEMQENRRLHKLEIFCSNAKVIDSSNSFLWPTYYTIHNKHYGLVKVECYDPVYMNQAVKGEQVYIKAPMYIDLDTEEKIVILAPWIKESQVFKKVKK